MDKLVNINRVQNINAPIFLIHGEADQTVKIRHARKLHSKSKIKYAPMYVPGAGHNNIEEFAPDLADKIWDFVESLTQIEIDYQ